MEVPEKSWVFVSTRVGILLTRTATFVAIVNLGTRISFLFAQRMDRQVQKPSLKTIS